MPDNRVQLIIEGIDKASQVFNDLNKQLKVLRSESEKTGGGVGESFAKSKPHLEGMHDQLGKIRNQIMAIIAAWKLFDIARDSVLLASRVETLSAVLGVMGKNVNLTKAEMNAYVSQVKAMGITTEVSQQSVIRMVQAQLDLSQAGKLARVAQDAAVIGNINSSEALERLIHGIVTLQPEILRTMNITVNFENEYKKAGATMGKNMEQLTQAEKQQIALNAVLAEGVKIQGAYEAAMSTAGKQVKSMDRYTEELKLKLGDLGNSAFTAVVFEIVDGLKQLDASLSEMGGMSGGMTALSDDLQYGVLVALNDIKTLAIDVWNILKGFGPVVKLFLELIVMAVDGWGDILAAIRPVTEIMRTLLSIGWDFVQVLKSAANILTSIATGDFKGLKQSIKEITSAMSDLATKANEVYNMNLSLPESVANSLDARAEAKQAARDKVAMARQDKAEDERDAALQRAYYGLRKPTYAPGESPAKKAGKGAGSALETWASKMRDLDTDMQKALFPHDELARKLEDIRNKYDDLVAQAKKYAEEHKKVFDTSKVEEWRKVMERAAHTADAEKKLKAWTDIEQEITERTAPELQKRLAVEDKWLKDSEEKLRKAGFTHAEINEKMVSVTAAAAEKKKKIELDYINTIMEAETGRYLAQLDTMEKERSGSKIGITRQRISTYESRLASYQQRWENETDPVAKLALAEKIDQARSKLVDLNIVLQEQAGLLTGGLGKGLRDYLWEMRAAFQQGVEIARQTAQGMEQAFSDFFFDAFQGKLKTLSDYINAFAASAQRALANAMGQQITGGITSGISWLFGGGSATVPHEIAVAQHHSGGIVRKYIPTFHGGGLNRDERLVINKVNERYITEEQNEWLTGVARAAQGGQQSMNVKIELVNQSNAPLTAKQGQTQYTPTEIIIPVFIDAYERDVYGLQSMIRGG